MALPFIDAVSDLLESAAAPLGLALHLQWVYLNTGYCQQVFNNN